jgi:integrase/recombinase XerD
MSRRRRYLRNPDKAVRKPLAQAGPVDPHGLVAHAERHLDYLLVRGYSAYTVLNRRRALAGFLEWCTERGISRPEELTRVVVDLYQRHVARLTRKDGRPLAPVTQEGKLTALAVFGRWLARERLVPVNPAADIEMPKKGLRLPHAVLTRSEVERVMAVPDVTTPLGLRDRAILEVFYSTGIRRGELANLRVGDLALERGIVAVRQGKGKKDRFVPIGERAVAWVAAYLREARPRLLLVADDGALFLSADGQALSPEHISTTLKGFIRKAGVDKAGACHIFRHTMATLMLEGGADLTVIQHILGHANPQTTEIYAQMSIHRIKAVHATTHPGARLARRSEAPEGYDPDELAGELAEELESAGDTRQEAARREKPDDESSPRILFDEEEELLSLLAAGAADDL